MAKSTRNNDWKDRLNVVYSTNPDFNYQIKQEKYLSVAYFLAVHRS